MAVSGTNITNTSFDMPPQSRHLAVPTMGYSSRPSHDSSAASHFSHASRISVLKQKLHRLASGRSTSSSSSSSSQMPTQQSTLAHQVRIGI